MKPIVFIYLLWRLAVSAAWAQPTQPLVWHFPITRPHTGIILGNGTQGLMVWGTTRQLTITVGRAGFWDHRGGNEFTAKTTYQDVKRLLQAGNYAGIKEAFAIPKTGDQGFGCAQQLIAAGILAGGPLRLVHQLGDRYLLNGQPATGSLFQKNCQKGEGMVLKPL